MAQEDQRQGIGASKVKVGLTAFLYQGRTIVGIAREVAFNDFTLVVNAIELKFQMTKDDMGNPGIGTSPFPLLPANGPATLRLPPCAHFDVSRDEGVIGVWEMMTGGTSLLSANGPLPPLPALRR